MPLPFHQQARQSRSLITHLQHGVNMNTTLTTFDGFPRSDVDVAQSNSSPFALSPTYRRWLTVRRLLVRTVRARIIPLRNDYKHLMARVEEAVHTQFASNAAATSSTSSQANTQRNDITSSNTGEAAFARIDSVVPGSPAQTAGLRAGDRVQRFGDANWLNHEKLARVAQVVAQNEGVSLLECT